MATGTKHIFIIEDDAILGKIYTEILEFEGHQISWVQDGQEALDTLKKQTPPDLILLDLHLPGLSGREVLTTLQKDARFAQVKVVIATADGFQAKELEYSVDMVLLKPISYEQLVLLCHQLFTEG